MVTDPTRQKQDIAKELKVSNATISQWVKREDFQEALKAENQRLFSSASSKAVKAVTDLLNSKNEGIRLAAAREILSKAGYDAPQKVEQTVHNIEIEIVD